MSADLIEQLAKQSQDATDAIESNATAPANTALEHKYNLGEVVYFPVMGEITTIGEGKVVALSFLDNGGVNYSIANKDGKVVVMPENFVSNDRNADILGAYYTHAFRCMVKEMIGSGMTAEDIKNIIINSTGAKQ